MLSRRTSALLAILPVGLVVVLVLTQHGAPAAKPLPPLPSREEIARAQAFFKSAEAVCYRSWGELRRLPEARRPENIGPTMTRLLHIHEQMVVSLERLGPPPPRAARKFRRAVALLRARNRELRRSLPFFTSRSIAHASPAEVRRELRRFAGPKLNAELDRIADPMGLWKCRK
jgi:hypothetical protein